MKTRPIEPAQVEFDADGSRPPRSPPRSPIYGDLYHPQIGALAQARHVFLGGNDLPRRWAGQARFVVLEMGFGLGNNFLATWDAWRNDPSRCERLVVVSIERHPLQRGDLLRAHAQSALPELAAALIHAWPPLVPGLQALDFDGGAVQLLLALGDVRLLLPALRVQADAIYLDGFAPTRNPQMWEPRVLKALGRHATPSASAATWSVACGLNVPGAITIGPGFPGVYANCPNANPGTAGPDHDFAQGPMLFGADRDNSGHSGHGGHDLLVGAGQKSGVFWAFRARDGKPAWARQVAPGGVTGGLQWGSATNGRDIFVAVANSGPSTNGGGAGALPWTLKDGSVTSAGGWASLDARTGAVQWTTRDPMGSRAEAAVSLANNVVFGCNMAAGLGTMYALHAKTGKPLWSYNSGAPCTAGPSIVDGMVYWGSGTFGLFGPTGPKKVFAFGLN